MRSLLLFLIFVGSSVMSLLAQDLLFKDVEGAKEYATKIVTDQLPYKFVKQNTRGYSTLLVYVPDTTNLDNYLSTSDIPGVIRVYIDATASASYIKSIKGRFEEVFAIWGEYFNRDATRQKVISYEGGSRDATLVKDRVKLYVLEDVWEIRNSDTY